MANRNTEISSHKHSGAVLLGFPAFFAFGLPVLLVLFCLYALWSTAFELSGAEIAENPFKTIFSNIYILRTIEFTLMQAVLSAFISLLLAIPLARALAFRSFPGRKLVLSLFGAPFILPVIVAILGLLAVWGKNGLVNQFLACFGVNTLSIYGLQGILLAHVFFNLPLASRLLLQGWNAIPAEQWRLAAQLGMSSRAIARHIEGPMLKQYMPGAFALIFLLCVTSFTIVLALGGGPKATTIELAIYQAIRYDFDLQQAAILAFIQILLCAGLAISSRFLASQHDQGDSLGRHIERADLNSLTHRIKDISIIGLAIAFLGLPLTAAFTKGLIGLFSFGIEPQKLIFAIMRSLTISAGAIIVMLLVSLPLAQASLHIRGRKKILFELPGFAIMVAPPIALGAGLFILLHEHVSVDELALPLTSLLNGLQSVPFALILISPAMEQTKKDYGNLCAHLDLKGWAGFRLVHWPLTRKAIGLAMGICAALSMGDLGVIALFGSPSEPTLPLYLYQQMGAYHMDQAYGSGLLLTALALLAFILFDKGVGGRDKV